jgi:hypothetical protein
VIKEEESQAASTRMSCKTTAEKTLDELSSKRRGPLLWPYVRKLCTLHLQVYATETISPSVSVPLMRGPRSSRDALSRCCSLRRRPVGFGLFCRISSNRLCWHWPRNPFAHFDFNTCHLAAVGGSSLMSGRRIGGWCIRNFRPRLGLFGFVFGKSGNRNRTVGEARRGPFLCRLGARVAA